MAESRAVCARIMFSNALKFSIPLPAVQRGDVLRSGSEREERIKILRRQFPSTVRVRVCVCVWPLVLRRLTRRGLTTTTTTRTIRELALRTCIPPGREIRRRVERMNVLARVQITAYSPRAPLFNPKDDRFFVFRFLIRSHANERDVPLCTRTFITRRVRTTSRGEEGWVGFSCFVPRTIRVLVTTFSSGARIFT